MMAKELVDRNCCTAKVCETLSVPRSTFYRHRKTASSCRVKRSVPPKNKIGDEDRAKIFHILHDERFIDLCPREIVPTLADEGIYLGSIRSFYRVLAANNELCERRNIARHPKHCAPVLEANAPGEVWSWDITHIKGPWKGCNFYLYVMIDIYSRYVVGWMLAERENARRAQHFIRETVARHKIHDRYLTIHNDRGSPMKAGSTRELIHLLGIEHSFSRPRTSDGNPLSETTFKTLKYHHTFPDFFESMEEGRAFFSKWFQWYNEEHRHTGLNLHTPASVHFGTVEEVVKKRQMTMDVAYTLHPERFAKGRPVVQMNPKTVGINLHLKANILTEASVSA